MGASCAINGEDMWVGTLFGPFPGWSVETRVCWYVKNGSPELAFQCRSLRQAPIEVLGVSPTHDNTTADRSSGLYSIQKETKKETPTLPHLKKSLQGYYWTLLAFACSFRILCDISSHLASSISNLVSSKPITKLQTVFKTDFSNRSLLS